MKRGVLPLRATCRCCGDEWSVRQDGAIRGHGLWRGPCRGSGCLPVEGVLMGCIWCGRLFLSEDEAHRFCSDPCVDEWTTKDGTWADWDLPSWLQERAEREEALTLGLPAEARPS